MSYIPSFPLPLSMTLVGLFVKSPPLLMGVPETTYDVIIPLYNKQDLIVKCLESVFSQTKHVHKVIVIDDNSQDLSLELVKQHFEDRVILLRNERNLGKAASINEALSYVDCPYVLILDADTILDREFAHKAFCGFYAEDVHGVCGTVLPLSDKSSIGKARLIEYLEGMLAKNFQAKIGGIWVLSGCATIWRASFLKENPMPNHIVEDMLQTWVAQKNGKVNYVKDAVCYTQDPEKFGDWLKQIKRWYSNGDVVKNNFREVKTGLKATCFWAYTESISFLVLLGMFLYLLFIAKDLIALFSLATLDIGLTLLTVLISAGRLGVSKIKALKALPHHLLVRIPNAIMFLLYHFKSIISNKK